MASPFQVFRKNRKTMLAALTIMAMFAFVFLPNCIDRTGGRSAQVNPVIVSTTAYGDLRARDISILRQQRQHACGILRDLIEKIRLSGGDSRKAEMKYMEWNRMDDESLVQMWLLDHYATDRGVVVDDEAVRKFLEDITDNRLDAKEIRDVFNKQNLTDYAAFTALRGELLWDRALRLFLPQIGGITPAQRYDFYKRLNRAANIEFVPIEVERFVDAVEPPSENVLKAFYNEHKDTIQTPMSPEVGFREPARVELRYFKVDFDKFAAANVTEEEIQQEYEKNKERYDELEKRYGKLGLPATEPPKGEANDGKKPDEGTPAREEKQPPAEKQPPQESQPTEKPATEKPATEKPATEKPATEKPATEKPATEKPATEKPATEQPATEKPATEKPASEQPPVEGASSVGRPSPFRFASLLQEPAADAKPVETQAADAGKAEEKAEAPAQPGEEKKEPAATKPTDETKQGKNEKISLLKDALAPQGKELSPTIKRFVRYQVASEKLDKIYGEMQKIVKGYRDARSAYQKAKKTNPDAQEPTVPDYQKIAADHGMTFTETKLSPWWELQDLDIARARFGNASVLQAVLPSATGSAAIGLDSMQRATDMVGNQYFFWKVRETKEETPKFSAPEMRDKVLHTWRMVKARELAKAEADKLLAEAKKSGVSLRETFANQPRISVIDPPPFTWLTYGSTTPFTSRTPPQLSEVQGVQYPGEAFMKTVFNLEPGGLGTTMNEPENCAYVIRLISFNRSEENLRETFETAQQDTFASLAQQEQRQLQRDWYQSIVKSAGLKWERRPNQPVDESGKEKDAEQ